jgi:type 1 glutamine amidotransferase
VSTRSSNPTALILTGADRYDGKWHDHAATSQRIAEILGEIGINARLRGTHPRNLGDLATADLLVVNAANGAPSPDDADDDAWTDAFTALETARDRGIPLLAFHLSAAAFKEWPGWRPWLGGEWVVGTSMHPPIAQSTVTVNTATHPIISDLTSIAVFDEMYSYLETEPGNTILATHTYEDIVHPVAWARETGPGRVVYNALGHDIRSYDSPDHIAFIQRAAQWLLED